MSHEHEHNALDPALSGIEDALGSLAPAPSRLDRDRLMFRAGQAANRPSPFGQRLWVAIAASTALIALGEATMLARRPAAQIIEKVVVVREPAASPVLPTSPERPVVPPPTMPPTPPTFRTFEDSPSFGPSPYDRLTSQVFRYGLDGLPTPPSARGNAFEPLPDPTRQLLQDELRETLELGDPS